MRYREPAMSVQERIEINPKVMLGKPVIRGTRITVELILRKLGEGATQRELLAAYPHLTLQDIQAAITYAADTLAHEETVPLEPQGVNAFSGAVAEFLADADDEGYHPASGPMEMVSVSKPDRCKRTMAP